MKKISLIILVIGMVFYLGSKPAQAENIFDGSEQHRVITPSGDWHSKDIVSTPSESPIEQGYYWGYLKDMKVTVETGFLPADLSQIIVLVENGTLKIADNPPGSFYHNAFTYNLDLDTGILTFEYNYIQYAFQVTAKDLNGDGDFEDAGEVSYNVDSNGDGDFKDAGESGLKEFTPEMYRIGTLKVNPKDSEYASYIRAMTTRLSAASNAAVAEAQKAALKPVIEYLTGISSQLQSP